MADFQQYYDYLQQISPLGLAYKRHFVAPILCWQARQFGRRIAEVGCGIGSGMLGAYPQQVVGFEINPFAVAHCQKAKFNVRQIGNNQPYPAEDGEFDVCILDNVLEHILEPDFILGECGRITRTKGGLIIVVPGHKGYATDTDHKHFYGEQKLKDLHANWQLQKLFSLPFWLLSETCSKLISQYCLVAVYQKQ